MRQKLLSSRPRFHFFFFAPPFFTNKVGRTRVSGFLLFLVKHQKCFWLKRKQEELKECMTHKSEIIDPEVSLNGV